MTTNRKRPLMGVDNILQMQDNGYKSSVSAISEIIDNSIQANAKIIDIVIIRNTTRSKNEIDELLIIDDGDGMDMEVFDKALQMSSGTRGTAKSGLGKYGQGLPNASISQTKRVEVYTCQNNKILFNHVDLDEIYESGEAYLPDAESVSKINIPLFRSGKIKTNKTGTIVRWCSPNKIRPKTAKVLSEHIEMLAGRMFRYFLNGYDDGINGIRKCKINVLVYDYNGSNYEINLNQSRKEILPFDPMFLMEKTQMNSLFPESSHPTSDIWPELAIKPFDVNYMGKKEKTKVEIKLSYCKREERDRYGRNAGSNDFGKKYLKRNLFNSSGYDNISIIRSGREIDAGNFGFISDVSDPTNRWWSAEIHIEPIIDSIVGVDNKKQQASEIRFLDYESLTDEDTHEILSWISKILAGNIKSVKNEMKFSDQSPGGTSGGGQGEPALPPGGHSLPGEPGTEDDIDAIELKKIKKEFFDWIKDRYDNLKDSEITKMVDYALSIRDNHIFIKSDLGDSALYSYKPFGTKVLIEINYTHSFYERFMKQFEQDPTQDKSLNSLRLLIGSLVNAEILNKTQDKSIIRDRRNLKTKMAESLDDYIDDLYSS